MSDSEDSYGEKQLHPHEQQFEQPDWGDDILGEQQQQPPVDVADLFDTGDDEQFADNDPQSPLEDNALLDVDLSGTFQVPLSPLTNMNVYASMPGIIPKSEPFAAQETSSPTQAPEREPEVAQTELPPSSPPSPTNTLHQAQEHTPPQPLLRAKLEPVAKDMSPVKTVHPTTVMSYLHPGDDEDGSDFEGYEQAPDDNVDMEGIMTNIFGESDDNEEFEGFAETELGASGVPSAGGSAAGISGSVMTGKHKKLLKKKDRQAGAGSGGESSSSSSDDDQLETGSHMGDDGFTNDFDRFMEKTREAQRRRKRRHDTNNISDVDDTIAEIVRRMREVAEEDRELVKLRQPAVKKVKMLPIVSDLLVKAYLRPAMIEAGILRSIMEWLSPLPDHSLPTLSVREELVKALLDFPPLDTDTLKESGIGKAIMYLRRHPNETSRIKAMCCRLIDQWSRVIFAQNTDFKSLSREDRIKRDREHLEKRRRTQPEVHSRRDLNRDLDSEERPLRPGDPGFVMRARVPQPSNRDYLIRPEWKVKTPLNDSRRMGDDEPEAAVKVKRFDRYFRELKTMKRKNKSGAGLSVEGRKMAL